MKKNTKVLNRAEDIIIKYHDDESIYYQELIKSYNEYGNLSNLDKTTNELYINHINGLCDMIVEKKHSKIIISLLIVILLMMFCLSTYSTINYFKMSKDVNGIIHRGNATLSVNYGNLENFNALTLSDMSEYQNLTPLTLSLSSATPNVTMKYNIYIIANNEGVEYENLLSRDAFLYNVVSNEKDSGIKDLKSATYDDGKILIYSSEFDTYTTDNIEIRMWIDNNYKGYENKIYRFKLYVEGYV